MIPKIYLSQKKKNLAHNPHPWFFSGALEKQYDLPPGEIVDLCIGEQFIARGYYNPLTSIAFRRLTSKREEIDTDFLIRRFQQAQKRIDLTVDLDETDCYRLIFGENTFLPGIVIDRYGSYFAVQLHTAGAERLKQHIVAALTQLYTPKGIINKSRINSRKLEGLTPMEEILQGDIPESLVIQENGILFDINLLTGQKTGTFLDQRDNRDLFAQFCPSGRVLNIFGYNGGFNLYLKGRDDVTSINLDVSSKAGDAFERNLKLNDMDPAQHQFMESDVFQMVAKEYRFEEKFDAIILDPPALAKNRKQQRRALEQYVHLNRFALANLKSGGILLSSSCTSIISPEQFQEAISRAANLENTEVMILEQRINSVDHPALPQFPEGSYLKCFILYKN